MSGPCRLASGGRIDRGRPLAFRFDGRALSGYAGDTLASALLADGVTLLGRSFKYHRPRGLYAAGVEEPNALVTLGSGARTEANIPATTVELVDGLEARSQNRWPSLALDLQAVNGLFAPLLPAGFYYKTFMGPTRRSWMAYEPFIRRAAGLGRASEAPDPDRYETRHAFCEVAVIGAGPAGLAAALVAARSGARVVLIEQDFQPGGSLLAAPAEGAEAEWLKAVTAELESLTNARIMLRTSAFGLYDGGVLGLLERRDSERPDAASGRARQSLVMLRAGAIVFATGAIERPLVFAGNDRPGVMLAGAARTYLNRFAVRAGSRIVVATGNDAAYAAAIDLARAGATVVLADARESVDARLAARAAAAGIELRAATAVLQLRGRQKVRAVVLARAGKGEAGERVDCDLLCVSGGFAPSVHLTSHLGTRPRYREDIDAFVPGALGSGQFAAGAVTGTFAIGAVIGEGAHAGAAAAQYCGRPACDADVPALADELAPAARPVPLRVSAAGKAFLDLQNDVTVEDVRLAHREGYRSVEHLKRYTTLSMGTDQGKTSSMNALALLADLRGEAVAELGTTTFRPPFTPVAIGALAGRSVGRHFRPLRRTPMHEWHVANGAEMIEVGLWQRPWFYRAAGADAGAACIAEMRHVRAAAGLCDISTLGKIAIQGPDAASFLDRIYVNDISGLPVGRARYGVMLRDDGIVLDDGTVTRLGRQSFYVTTSTAKAADVLCRLEFLLETAWPELRVTLTDLTDALAAMSVAGPKSRAVLGAALPDLDVSDAGLPHMGAIEARGGRLCILRLSYSGERAYEIHVDAAEGLAMWERLIELGGPLGLRPYGVEALGALRIEKGHVAGPEIDGRTTLEDLGLQRLASRKKPFAGQVLARRPAFTDPQRPRLVGLECLEDGKRLRSGALLFAPGDTVAGHGGGRVTSATFSPTLGKSIALGLYQGGLREQGREVIAVYPMKGENVRARIVSPVFLDPQGERLRG